MKNRQNKKIRWKVVLPPWLCILAIVVLNLSDYDLFLATLTGMVNAILENFAWMFNGLTLLTLAVVVVTYFSPVKNVRFGGASAKPLISYTHYIWIVLCTIMGAGLMLWACAEPLTHIHQPPANVAGGPMSGEAILWAMETVFLEWTFSPMAVYAVPSLLFAFVFYNMRRPFSVGSMLSPLLGASMAGRVTPWVDMFCLFSISFAIASSLGSGVLIITEGVSQLSGGVVQNTTVSWCVCAAIIIVSFTISAASGLQRGIKHLSTINAWFYLALGIFMLICGPTRYILNLCAEALGAYLSDFFKLSLWTSTAYGDGWSLWWPQFYWCIWFSWMPVSAVFLGRISRGYTVRQTLNAVFWIPAAFSVLWMALFSGSSIWYELAGYQIYDAMLEGNIASAAYMLLQNLPLANLVIPVFLFTALISYVTSADSNVNAISGLCTSGLTENDSETSLPLKLFWGVTIGGLCIVMLTAFGIDGMKMLADLGGFPAALLMALFLAAWLRILKSPAKFDIHSENYDEAGMPRISKSKK